MYLNSLTLNSASRKCLSFNFVRPFFSRCFFAFSVIDISLKCVCVAQREFRVGRAANHVRNWFVCTWVHWNLQTAILSSPQNTNMNWYFLLRLDIDAMRKILEMFVHNNARAHEWTEIVRCRNAEKEKDTAVGWLSMGILLCVQSIIWSAHSLTRWRVDE